ncbi:MAG: glycosyltransferase [Thermoplasmata archaeon]
MLKKSTIITDGNLKSGIGKYAWNLYNLGFFEKFAHLSYNGISDFENHVFLTKHWGLNTFISYYIGGPYKKYIKDFNYVHASSPVHFHLVKYNKNMVGTIHDFFAIQYPQTKMINFWFVKNLKFLQKLKGVVVISDHIRQQAEEMFKDIEFIRIHLWIDNDNFKSREKDMVRKKLNLEKEKIYLLNVSRDVPRKNIDLLPKIINKLDERFVLIRIGETDRIIDQFKNRKQVISLLAVDENIYPLYFNASNLLIHTAIDGGFELPFIEALFSDIPILTFNMPISKEVLRDKGIYINFNKDDPTEWVDMIYKYFDKKIDYGDLKNYYKPERAKKEYETFYRNLGWLD